MKYAQRANGSYEHGLNVASIYRLTSDLIHTHLPTRKLPGPTRFKEEDTTLWMHPPIRSELEEFVDSYFLDNLPNTPQNFKASFKDYLRRDYSGFGQYLASELSPVFNELKKRTKRMYSIIKRFRRIKKPELDLLVKKNAIDAFAHIAYPYLAGVDFAIEDLGITS